MKATHGKTITRIVTEVQKRGYMQDACYFQRGKTTWQGDLLKRWQLERDRETGAVRTKEELRREAAAGTVGCGSEQSSVRKSRWHNGAFFFFLLTGQETKP